MFKLPPDDDLHAVFRNLLGDGTRFLDDMRDIFGLVLLCYLAGYKDRRAVNHVLLEGLNGTAKTTLVVAFNRLVIGPQLRLFYQLTGLDEYARIDGSPDLTAGDVVGYDAIGVDPQTGRQRLVFKEGPILQPCMVVYSDEHNRSPPKTMSALLQAMAEGKVTISTLDDDQRGRRIRRLLGFFLIASQNPPTQEGTFPQPEAMLDRFMVKITMSYTRRLGRLIHVGEPVQVRAEDAAGELRQLLEGETFRAALRRAGALQRFDALGGAAEVVGRATEPIRTERQLEAVREAEALLLDARRAEWGVLFDEVRHIEFTEATAEHIARLVYDTWSPEAYAAAVGGSKDDVPIPIDPARPLAEAVRHVAQGASPRAAIALRDLSLALAWATGGPGACATRDHVHAVAQAVLRHRLTLRFQSVMNGVTEDMVLRDILDYRAARPLEE